MISLALSFQLRDAGLRWEPESGDRFVVNQPHLLDTPFVLSEMTVEVRTIPTGRIIAFNGTTEWALDSVELHRALWLPGEARLRELLGDSFQRLERTVGADGGPAGYRVAFTVRAEERFVEDPDPAECYGEALLVLLREGVAPFAARHPGGNQTEAALDWPVGAPPDEWPGGRSV